MGLMYVFVSEQEKNYRRSDLHDKFSSIFCDYFENDEERLSDMSQRRANYIQTNLSATGQMYFVGT